MFRPMKPETIERRRQERQLQRARQRRDTTARLRALAERDGPDSIWAEMLADRQARCDSAAGAFADDGICPDCGATVDL